MIALNAILFWTCLALAAYAYAGYPFVIWLLARYFAKPSTQESGHATELPSATMLIAAYNEEAVIRQRVENALAVDYPSDRFQIVIASDGSSDATGQIVRRFDNPQVKLLDYPQRRGKASVLNSAMKEIDSEIVLLSDANTEIDPAAARKLIRHFGDSSVGAVCGRLVLVDPKTGRNADGMYWKYETFLKRCEGKLGGLLGANGAIYALRRDVFRPIPPNTIVDDFVIPLLAHLRTGYRIVYEYEAIAHEETAKSVGDEFHRRARIGAGGFQSIGMLWQLLIPTHGWLTFTFLSHKILRWLCPFLLGGMFLCSAWLWRLPLYRFLLIAQVLFYLLSVIPVLVPQRVRVPKPLRLATMFSSMNAALFAGFLRWSIGAQSGIWNRTNRNAESGTVS